MSGAMGNDLRWTEIEQRVLGIPPDHALVAAMRRHLCQSGLTVRECSVDALLDASDVPLLLVLPILGDNDLTGGLHAQLQRIANSLEGRTRAVLVMLFGDRHVSDDELPVDSPIHVKLDNLFARRGVFRLWRTKVDGDTVQGLASEMAAFCRCLDGPVVSALQDLSEVLERRASWDPIIRKLDLHCGRTGFGLLHGQSVQILAETARCIARVRPEILLMRGASLTDTMLAHVAEALCARVLDVGSNDLTFAATAALLPAGCRWLSMSANQLTSADLSALPEGVEQVHLQKNHLDELRLEGRRPDQFVSLSLYRNRMARLDWPADQRAIVRLNLGANPIAALPDALAQADRLESLGLARTGVQSLPDWVFDMPRLRHLDISHIEDRLPRSQLRELRRKGFTLTTRPGYQELA
jgi:hypothetical protein